MRFHLCNFLQIERHKDIVPKYTDLGGKKLRWRGGPQKISIITSLCRSLTCWRQQSAKEIWWYVDIHWVKNIVLGLLHTPTTDRGCRWRQAGRQAGRVGICGQVVFTFYVLIHVYTSHVFGLLLVIWFVI